MRLHLLRFGIRESLPGRRVSWMTRLSLGQGKSDLFIRDLIQEIMRVKQGPSREIDRLSTERRRAGKSVDRDEAAVDRSRHPDSPSRTSPPSNTLESVGRSFGEVSSLIHSSRSELESLRAQLGLMHDDRARMNEVIAQNTVLEARVLQQEQELESLARTNTLLKAARDPRLSNDTAAEFEAEKRAREAALGLLAAERERSDALLKTLNEERARHSGAIQELESRLAEDFRRREELQAELHRSELRVMDTMALYSRHRSKMDELQTQLKSATSQLAESALQLDDHRNQLRAAQEAYRSEAQARVLIQGELANREERIRNLEAEVQSVRSGLQGEVAATRSGLEAEVAQVRGTLVETERTLSEVRAAYASLQVQQTSERESLISLRERLSEAEKQVSEIRERGRQDELKITELRASVMHAQRRERELRAEVENRESAITALNQELQVARNQIQQLEIRLSESIASLAAVNERSAADERRLQQMREECQKLARQLETEKELRRNEARRIPYLEELIKQSEQRESSLQQELAKKADSHLNYERMKASYAELRARVEEGVQLRAREVEAREALVSELKLRESRIAELEQQIEGLRRNWGESEARLRESNARLEANQEQSRIERENAEQLKFRLKERDQRLEEERIQRKRALERIVQLEAAVRHYEQRQRSFEEDHVRLSELGGQHEVLKSGFAQVQEEADRLRALCDSLIEQLKDEKERHKGALVERDNRVRLLEERLTSARSELDLVLHQAEMNSPMVSDDSFNAGRLPKT